MLLGKCKRRKGYIACVVIFVGLIAVISWGATIYDTPIFLVTPIPLNSQSRIQDKLVTKPGTEAPPERLWHLDLKGSAPRIEIIEGLMTLASKAGATGVLIEWEDMFPYTGEIANLSAKNAYSILEVKRIVSAAKAAGLQIIHLMQSLGHLEYALKQEQWKTLREGNGPAEACPSTPDTVALVTSAIEQLMSAVPTSMLHIGADEVFTLGQCPRCRARNLSPLEIYTKHVATIAHFVKERWGVRVLMWDDMLRHAPARSLYQLASLVEPVVWAYGPDVTKLVPPHILRTYANIFPKVWLAPAFRGATGPQSIMPDAARHAANTLAWVEIGQRLHEYAGLGVAGMIVTGWARYDHFAVLTELLPSSSPSLVLTLLVASRGFLTPAVLRDTHALLECPPHVVLQPAQDPLLWKTRDCAYPGSNISTMLHRYVTLRHDVRHLRRDVNEVSGWLTSYNIKHNFSSPTRVREATANVRSYISALKDLYEETSAVLPQYLNAATVDEWQEQHLGPLNNTLSSLYNAANILTAHNTWPRRPLNTKHYKIINKHNRTGNN